MNYAMFAIAVVGVIEVGVIWFVARGLRRFHQVESRLAHLTDALTLLTETAEAGFRANAVEIGRFADRAVTGPVAIGGTATRRMATAARKGLSISDIAAIERASEGEVGLRLHLAKCATARRQKTRGAKENGNAALRS